MAGAGYKLFQTGDVLTAAQVNTYLNEQTVMVFASAAARTSALTSVLSEGMVSYLQDTNAVEVYDGSAWVGIGNSGDITGVTAGTGITGGGTSGTVTITNDMATTITAAGDIVVGTGSGTYDNLPIGTTGQVLTADTTVSPYKVKWASAGGASYAWTNYTPTWTNLTVGNGTVVARYLKVDKLMTVYVLLTFGSTTSITGAVPQFTVPEATTSNWQYTPIFLWQAGDYGTNSFAGSAYFEGSTTKVGLYIWKANGTYISTSVDAVTSTVPHTWTTNDTIGITFTYEVA